MSRKQVLSLAVAAVFLVALSLALTAERTVNSVLSPELYASHLRENEVFEFVLVDLATSFLEERREVEQASAGGDIDDTPLLTLGLSTNRIVEGINRSVPPHWLERVAESNIYEFGDYLAGRSDDFTLVFPLEERTDILMDEFRAMLDEAAARGNLYGRVMVPRLEEAAEDWVSEGLPFGLDITSERMAKTFRAVLPREWVRAHGVSAFDQVTPWLKGESDQFTVRVDLSDRVDIAKVEVKRMLAEGSSHDLLYREVIAPEVTGRLGDTIAGLPFGAEISSDDVVSVMREAATSSWVRSQVERLIDESSPYIAGQADGFAFEVSIVDNKRIARGVLIRLVEERVRTVIDRLPACPDTGKLRSYSGNGSQIAPPCIPSGVTHGQALADLGVDIGAEVDRLVLDSISNTVYFTHEELRDALEDSGDQSNAWGTERLDDVRSILRDDWTYTQHDLMGDLTANGDESVYESLQEARSLLADGWVYTSADFAEAVTERYGVGRMEDIDRWRGTLRTVGNLRWLVYLPALLLLACVAYLGGSGWQARVKWAAASLLVCALVIFVLSAVVHPTVASGLLDNARVQALEEIDPASEYAGTSRLAVDKGFDLLQSVSESLAAGMASLSLAIAAFSAITLAVAFNWSRIRRLVRRP